MVFTDWLPIIGPVGYTIYCLYVWLDGQHGHRPGIQKVARYLQISPGRLQLYNRILSWIGLIEVVSGHSEGAGVGHKSHKYRILDVPSVTETLLLQVKEQVESDVMFNRPYNQGMLRRFLGRLAVWKPVSTLVDSIEEPSNPEIGEIDLSKFAMPLIEGLNGAENTTRFTPLIVENKSLSVSSNGYSKPNDVVENLNITTTASSSSNNGNGSNYDVGNLNIDTALNGSIDNGNVGNANKRKDYKLLILNELKESPQLGEIYDWLVVGGVGKFSQLMFETLIELQSDLPSVSMVKAHVLERLWKDNQPGGRKISVPLLVRKIRDYDLPPPMRCHRCLNVEPYCNCNCRVDDQEEIIGGQGYSEQYQESKKLDVRPEVTIWKEALGELRMQMTKNTFNSWLADSYVVEVLGDNFVIGVKSVAAVEWLTFRLKQVIQETLSSLTERRITVQFVTK